MVLDVRSLGEWMKAIFGHGRLSGGGPLGRPSIVLDEAALEQETADAGSAPRDELERDRSTC